DRRQRELRLGRRSAAFSRRGRSRSRPPAAGRDGTGGGRERAVSRSEAAELSRSAARLDDTRIAAALLALLSVFILFHSLGGAALFDPDEGRNAEIAREVLVTNDWITPYYDFLPRLEKPML